MARLPERAVAAKAPRSLKVEMTCRIDILVPELCDDILDLHLGLVEGVCPILLGHVVE